MATQSKNEFDQRPESQQKPPREVPDFPALAKQFGRSAGDLEILWDRHDQIQSVGDFKFFLFYCKENDLEPLGEAIPLYRWDPIKRREVITPIVSIGVMRKRRATECDGLDQFKFEHVGTGPDSQLVSASGTIYRKECAHPFSATVYYDEYAATDRQGNLSSIWVGKGHMLLSKCLEAQLTRLAFFDLIGELMIDEETQKRDVASEDAAPTAKAEEFKVGEKPEPVAETKPAIAETKADPVVETKPATTETKPPVAEAKAAVAETKAAVIEMPKPAAEPSFTIKVVVAGEDGKQTLQDVKGELPQNKKEAAGLRARALANEFKISFVVCDEQGEQVIICNPLSAAHGKAPHAAAPQPVAAPDPIREISPAPFADLPALTFDDMITKATTAIGGTAKEAAKYITRYIAAYLNVSVKALPKDREKLTPPLTALMPVLDQRVGDLKADPEGLGATLAGRPVSVLDREFAMLRWPPAIREVARKVMALLGQNETDFISWLGMTIAGDTANGTALAISSLEPAALEVLLPLYLLVKSRAFEVIDFAIASNEAVTKTLQEMVTCSAKAMAEWDAPFATKILDAIQGIARKNAAAAPPPPPADDLDSWSTGGLPFEDA